jgi:hypothetical protein
MIRKVADTPGSFAKAGGLEIFVEQVCFSKMDERRRE